MRWEVSTPPSGTVLTWAQLKAHIHPASVSEQPYIMDLLTGATAYAETLLESCLLPQVITVTYDQRDIGFHPWEWGTFTEWNRGYGKGFEIPRGPIIDIDSVQDVDGNDIEYFRHTAGNSERIVPLVPIYPESAPYTIIYEAGYPPVDSDSDEQHGIPADIISAIRVHVATMYMVRENVTNLSANPVHKIDDFYRFKGRNSYVG